MNTTSVPTRDDDNAIDESALREWAENYELHFDLQREQVRYLPEFRAWADSIITSPTQSEGRAFPGWTEDDCTHKWVQTYGFEFPEPPIATPKWAPAISSRAYVADPGEIHISFKVELSIEDHSVSLERSIFVRPDAIVDDWTVSVDGFDERLLLGMSELDAAITCLTTAREAITG